jgi:hypothetical protein
VRKQPAPLAGTLSSQLFYQFNLEHTPYSMFEACVLVGCSGYCDPEETKKNSQKKMLA